ncbi:hypothetical protein GN958_ATG12767 [Phytophthora infestans]|uniref:Uncharacterized protein n=1 Tax=Phytophthora infestans TaxID=4787 RepID=A0A8S9UFS2_PHYIN|nr:hypothetical protein GN958_ATG12767 [Phytophthora infestans]
MLITMQNYAEERYLAEFHRVGSRPPISEDPELTALAMQLSNYAFKMVKEQHKLALGLNASYDIEVDGMRTTLTNPATGDVSAGGLTRVNCQPIRALPAIDRDTKYSRSKQLSEKFIDVMSLQPSTTFRLAMKWLEGFHTALHTGQLEDFVGIEPEATPSVFPNLSQVSDTNSVTISQLSFGEPSGNKILDEDQPITNNAGSAAAPIVFGSPPKRRGLSTRAEKKEVSKKELKEAKRILTCIREGKKARAVKLCHMEILSGPISSSTTRPLLDRLKLPNGGPIGGAQVQRRPSGPCH